MYLRVRAGVGIRDKHRRGKKWFLHAGPQSITHFGIILCWHSMCVILQFFLSTSQLCCSHLHPLFGLWSYFKGQHFKSILIILIMTCVQCPTAYTPHLHDYSWNSCTLQEASVFKRYSCSATPHACPYYFFLCWLVLIFDFFINHAWGIGARALNMCNYTCRDMHSPLHVVCLHTQKKEKSQHFQFCVVSVTTSTLWDRVTLAS